MHKLTRRQWLIGAGVSDRAAGFEFPLRRCGPAGGAVLPRPWHGTRLCQIKAQCDPGNLLRFEQSVRPG